MPSSVAKSSPSDAPEVCLQPLTADLAHNVNNALTGVIGYLELALQRPPLEADVDACVRAGLDCAYQAADAVRRIVGCARRVAQADRPAPQSLRRLAQAAAQQIDPMASVAGGFTGPVLVSEDLLGLALDGMLRVVGSAGGLQLCVAEQFGRCALYVEGVAPYGPEMQRRLLEASLMIEIQGGALEVLSAPGQPSSLKASFPCFTAGAVRRDEAQSDPPAPHMPETIGLFRQAV
jgi:hypothetical protein